MRVREDEVKDQFARAGLDFDKYKALGTQISALFDGEPMMLMVVTLSSLMGQAVMNGCSTPDEAATVIDHMMDAMKADMRMNWAERHGDGNAKAN